MNCVFSVPLLTAAYKLWKLDEGRFDPADSRIYRLASRYLPTSERFEDGRFTSRVNERFVSTRLLVVLLPIELADLMFAIL